MNIADYTRVKEQQEAEIKRVSKQIYLFGTIRLIVFTLLIIGVWACHENTALTIAIILAGGAIFVQLLKHSDKLGRKKSYAQSLQKICNDELKAFQYDYSPFDGAAEKIDPAHDFSFDLDVFGERSLFQSVNRTTLSIGKEKLCLFFQFPLTQKERIEERQQAVRELSGKEAFCLHFRAVGNLSKDIFSTQEEMKSTFSTQKEFQHSAVWKLMGIITPLLYVTYIVLGLLKIVPFNYMIYLYLLTFAISGIPIKAVKRIRQKFDKRVKILKKYAQLFAIIENEAFSSPLLQEIQSILKDKSPASSSINKLAYYHQNLELSFTAALLFLNPFFLWNVRYALKIEDWMHTHEGSPSKWFSALAKLDALISLGTYASTHPDYVYPDVAEHFCMQGEAIGHPMIPREKCVKNDIQIAKKPFFMIITGANMAGKSTYLRTIGVNHLLASVGLPVCANRFRFYPGRLLTNLRTADSLVNNESYFFAELKRLKMIIDALQNGDDGLFIILDEILKGTNSEDKQKGSYELMKRLVHLNGSGIIATHDLILGKLEDEFPEEIRNFHFDSEINGDTLSFDYQLHRGIAKNMNANFLMRTMGIIVE